MGILGLACSLFGGCAMEEEDDVAVQEHAIVNGPPAYEWMWRRAVKPKPCTATLIAPRYAVLALHCTPANGAAEGSLVRFYSDGPVPNNVVTRTVVAVLHPPGTHRPPDNSRWDDFGFFGDIAILKLDADAPATSIVATLAWRFPGMYAVGYQVGAGSHDSMANPDGDLRYVVHQIMSSSDADGKFSVGNALGNPGDSGGPFYYSQRVTGIYFGGTSFTSVPPRLDWILGQIGWTWPHGASSFGYQVGTVLESFKATERVCQYACENSACEVYNYASSTQTCELVKDASFGIFTASWRYDHDATP